MGKDIGMKKEYSAYFVHFAMAAMGGFLGCYALLNHHELFGNAQTSNLIHIVTCLLGANWIELCYRLLDALLYFSGFAATVWLGRYTRLNLHFCSVIFDGLTMVILYLMPDGLNDFVSLSPVFFAMAFQWNCFRGAGEYISSTIFSTNNFRQLSTAFCEYVADREPEKLQKMRFFGLTLCSYHIGVAASFAISSLYGTKGVIAGLGFVVLAMAAVVWDNGWMKAVNPMHGFRYSQHG